MQKLYCERDLSRGEHNIGDGVAQNVFQVRLTGVYVKIPYFAQRAKRMFPWVPVLFKERESVGVCEVEIKYGLCLSVILRPRHSIFLMQEPVEPRACLEYTKGEQSHSMTFKRRW